MQLRTNVTFRTSIPFDRTVHAVGEEIAVHLAEAIRARTGWDVSIEDWRDSGYELDFVIDDKPLHFAFIHVEDLPFDFYGQVASYVGWIRRLFGYCDEAEAATVICAVHETLKDDPAFSDILWHQRWYDEARSSDRP